MAVKRAIRGPAQGSLGDRQHDSAPNIAQIQAAVDRSRSMLDWPDNWDGEGSPGYPQATWDRAVDFIMAAVQVLWQTETVPLSAPTVAPGPDGSIDVLWKLDDRKLSVNVPVAQTELASYYGKTSTGETVEGLLDLKRNSRWLWLWLM